MQDSQSLTCGRDRKMLSMGPEPQFPKPEMTRAASLIFLDSFFSNFSDPYTSSGLQELVYGSSFCRTIVWSPQGPA